jgi:hypothetical protein
VSAYQVGLFLHLVGAFTFFAGAVLAAVGFEAARRRPAPREVALLLGVTRTGALLVVAGGVVLLGAGFWLADHIGQLGSAWVLWSLGLFAAAVVLGALGGRRPKQARRLAATVREDDGDGLARMRALMDDRASLWANYGSTALIVAVLALMVWQPGR